MLVTKPLNKSVAFEDIDFSQSQRDYEMENALEVAECHFILNNADKMAIEAYVDYNGNETMLESQFATLTENALTDITKSLKDMVKRFIEFMAKFLNNLKNWFKGLFSKTQAFINKYKDDPTEIELELYCDFEDAKDAIKDFTDDYEKVVKKYVNEFTTMGRTVRAHEQEQEDFISVMCREAGTNFDYSSLTNLTISEFVSAEVTGRHIKRHKKMKLKDFVKDLQDFMKLEKATKNLESYKLAEKIFGALNKMTDNKSYMAVSAQKLYSFLTQLATAIPVAVKEVISDNIKQAIEAAKNIQDAEFTEDHKPNDFSAYELPKLN